MTLRYLLPLKRDRSGRIRTAKGMYLSHALTSITGMWITLGGSVCYWGKPAPQLSKRWQDEQLLGEPFTQHYSLHFTRIAALDKADLVDDDPSGTACTGIGGYDQNELWNADPLGVPEEAE